MIIDNGGTMLVEEDRGIEEIAKYLSGRDRVVWVRTILAGLFVFVSTILMLGTDWGGFATAAFLAVLIGLFGDTCRVNSGDNALTPDEIIKMSARARQFVQKVCDKKDDEIVRWCDLEAEVKAKITRELDAAAKARCEAFSITQREAMKASSNRMRNSV